MKWQLKPSTSALHHVRIVVAHALLTNVALVQLRADTLVLFILTWAPICNLIGLQKFLQTVGSAAEGVAPRGCIYKSVLCISVLSFNIYRDFRTMMRILILQICFATICFQGVYSSFSLHNIVPSSNFFRQTKQDQQCFNDQIDEHFDSNTEFFECAQMFGDSKIESEDDLEDFFDLLCTTECGDFFIDAAKECDFENASAIILFESLCETNSNGDVCYELSNTYNNYGAIESSCAEDLSNSGTCTCESDLEDAVEDLGCCIDAFHQIAEEFSGGSVNPQDVYDDCGVDLPAPCSTVSHHVYISMILFAMVVIALVMA